MKHTETALHEYNDLMQNEAITEEMKQLLTTSFAPMLREKRAVRDRVSVQSIITGERP